MQCQQLSCERKAGEVECEALQQTEIGETEVPKLQAASMPVLYIMITLKHTCSSTRLLYTMAAVHNNPDSSQQAMNKHHLLLLVSRATRVTGTLESQDWAEHKQLCNIAQACNTCMSISM